MEQEILNLAETGRDKEGRTVSSDRRLFMQLQVFGGCSNPKKVINALENDGFHGVVYADLNDPSGVGLLWYSESPDRFLTELRPLLNRPPFSGLTPKPHLTMLGRTYAIGYENDLDEVLIDRPVARVSNPQTPWAIWYPLRRAGSFEQLPSQEKRTILMEHGGVGRSFGQAGLGSDVRLACHGLDQNDNDFVIGLIGPELFPLSAIVQRMRQTKQTSLYLERLGPFFVGKAIWQQKPL